MLLARVYPMAMARPDPMAMARVDPMWGVAPGVITLAGWCVYNYDIGNKYGRFRG
jgi:hypothetical protein